LLGACAAPKPVASRAASTSVNESSVIGPAGVFPNEQIVVGQQKRLYRLVVPASVDRARPAPLLIAFHGMWIDSKDLMPR
jgi:poly(3-hydroxybutyrate) depolymerase